jgi:hypothetical protein
MRNKKPFRIKHSKKAKRGRILKPQDTHSISFGSKNRYQAAGVINPVTREPSRETSRETPPSISRLGNIAPKDPIHPGRAMSDPAKTIRNKKLFRITPPKIIRNLPIPIYYRNLPYFHIKYKKK